MKIKTTDLIGPPLNWAVAKARYRDGRRIEVPEHLRITRVENYPGSGDVCGMGFFRFAPSTEGDTVIDIMEREGIAAWLDFDGKTWRAADKRWTLADPDSEELARMSEPCSGPTLRIAVCRCFVASKLGDEVEVPDELLEK